MDKIVLDKDNKPSLTAKIGKQRTRFGAAFYGYERFYRKPNYTIKKEIEHLHQLSIQAYSLAKILKQFDEQ